MLTISVLEINGTPVVNGVRAREILKVRHRLTFNSDRAVFGLQSIDHFTQADLVNLFTLRLWLQARPGVNSRENFKRFHRQPALLRLKFQQWGIDLEERIQQFRESL